jgi:hypothetical protein
MHFLLFVLLQQNAAARIVVGAARYDPVSDHIKNLHWLPVEQRVVFKTAVLTFRCLNDSAPVYLSDLVKLYPTSTLTSIGRLNWVRFSGRGHPRWTLF